MITLLGKLAKQDQVKDFAVCVGTVSLQCIAEVVRKLSNRGLHAESALHKVVDVILHTLPFGLGSRIRLDFVLPKLLDEDLCVSF